MKSYVFFCGIFAMIFAVIIGTASCASNKEAPKSADSQQNSGAVEEDDPAEGSVYIGIISFAPYAEDITGGVPVLLDDEGYDKLQSILDEKYTRSKYQGTAIYYAMHLALANLSANESNYPKDLDSATIMTFTDGLDNASTSPVLPPLEGTSFAGKVTDEYLGYIKTQIINRRILDRKIKAYSAGVRGNDVSDIALFRSTLVALASKSEYAVELEDYTNLETEFSEIASSLAETSIDTTFVVTTPAVSTGTKVRMTFDVPENQNDSEAGLNSKRYLEGDIVYTDGTYMMTNVVYGGDIGSTATLPVESEINEYEVDFTFPSFKGYNAGKDTVKQWLMVSGSRMWQVNSEYRLEDSSVQKRIKHSGVIYLVLDSSTSLKDDDVEDVRDAAQAFITTLYEQIKDVEDVAEASADDSASDESQSQSS
ncbi:MAG: hypothetical protein LBD29_01905 [Treponema sp.]|jgi:hypothetical protein|nr:hypothetical protein [Treponema sp.]